jgi:hypothetical protein
MTPASRESLFELALQLRRRDVVRRVDLRGSYRRRLDVLERDDVDVIEDVLAVGALVAVAFRKGARL